MAGLKDEIVALLRRDPVVTLINFQLRGHPIRSDMYLAIADRIASGVIKVETKTLERGHGAEYLENVLSLPIGFKLDSVARRSAVIHECTHAIIEYHGIGMHDFAEDEACAYVAAGVYKLFHDDFSSSLQYQGKIAQSIAIDGAYFVNEDDAISLMIEIRLHKVYKGFTQYTSGYNW